MHSYTSKRDEVPFAKVHIYGVSLLSVHLMARINDLHVCGLSLSVFTIRRTSKEETSWLTPLPDSIYRFMDVYLKQSYDAVFLTTNSIQT